MNPNNTQNPEANQPEAPNEGVPAVPASTVMPTEQNAPATSEAPVITPASMPVIATAASTKSKKLLLVMVIIVLLALVLGAVYWFVLRDKTTASTPTGSNSNNSQNVADTDTAGPAALAALRADSDAANFTATSDAYTKNPATYRYYNKDGVRIAMPPVLTLVFAGYMDSDYTTDSAKVEEIMTKNGLHLVHGSMAASAWQGASGMVAYATYEGTTVSCSGRVGQAVGAFECQLNSKLTSIYNDVQAAWATFPTTVIKPEIALDYSTYYESSDGTVKAVGLNSSYAEHADGDYYDEYAVKVGSADWKYISSEAPLGTSTLEPRRPCSMFTKAEYKDAFKSITDSKLCVAS